MAALYWLLITSSAEGSRFGFHTRALFFFLESPLMPCFRVMVTVITHIITSSVLLLDRNISRNAAKENIIIHHFSSKWTLNCLNSLRNLAQWISQKHSRAMNLLLQLPCSDSHLYFPGIVITLWLSHEAHSLSHLSLVTCQRSITRVCRSLVLLLSGLSFTTVMSLSLCSSPGLWPVLGQLQRRWWPEAPRENLVRARLLSLYTDQLRAGREL